MLALFIFVSLLVAAIITPDPDLRKRRLALLMILALVGLVIRLLR